MQFKNNETLRILNYKKNIHLNVEHAYTKEYKRVK